MKPSKKKGNRPPESQAKSRVREDIRTPYGRFVAMRGDIITDQLKAFGAHTRNELAMLLRFVKDGDRIVDVGAHIGTFAVPFGIKTGPNGRIFAFEALRENFELLKENVGINRLDGVVKPVYSIVGGAGGYRPAFVDGNTGATHLLPGSAEDSGLSTTPNIGLDEWAAAEGLVERIDILKIDTEGMELCVLRSAKDILRRSRPVLYVEVCPRYLARHGDRLDELEGILKEQGYRFFRNIGERNSARDSFDIRELAGLSDGGDFYDLLAVHRDDRARIPLATQAV